MNSLKFTFGTGEGQYNPSSGSITDYIFSVCEISHILFENQSYETGFTQGSRSLNWGGLFGPVPGQTMTVVFTNSIKIEKY